MQEEPFKEYLQDRYSNKSTAATQLSEARAAERSLPCDLDEYLSPNIDRQLPVDIPNSQRSAVNRYRDFLKQLRSDAENAAPNHESPTHPKTLTTQSSTTDMPWLDAIADVLKAHAPESVNYRDIAEQIEKRGLRQSLGANPAARVSMELSNSLSHNGEKSPFHRADRGLYTLREYNNPLEEQRLNRRDQEQRDSVIKAFGMYWDRSAVRWKASPKLLARVSPGSDPVDVSDQIGIYLLYDAREVVYVGRSVDRPIGQRLFEHTTDRHRARWDRFSWFGMYAITDSGDLEKNLKAHDASSVVAAFEAILIEALEPRQNRRQGDYFKDIEYIQAEDPEVTGERLDHEIFRRLIGQRDQ